MPAPHRYIHIHCAGSAGTNNKWAAIIADDVRRGRKRFRTNDLFIPARSNGGGGGCGGDDDGDDNDDGDDDSVCMCVYRQDKENPYRLIQQPFRPLTVIDECCSSEECYCC